MCYAGFMPYAPLIHQRRSIRLRHWDYGCTSAYFVTLVTADRICWFKQSAFYACVAQTWIGLPGQFAGLELDAFVIMPNHVHFIVALDPSVNQSANEAVYVGQLYNPNDKRPTLGQVVRHFKGLITRQIRLEGGKGFAWQRGYYEEIIRSERALNAV